MIPRILSLGFLGLGVYILVQVILTFASFQLLSFNLSNQNKPLLNPLSNTTVLGVSVDNSKSDFPAFVSDYKSPLPLPYDYFSLSIPQIDLNDQIVRVESNNFDDYLSQLPGTAFPGDVGNLFITGHSSLPFLSSIGLVKAPFAQLPKIKVNDHIYIDAGGSKYDYTVIAIKIVDPKQVDVIYPPDNNGKYLSLMTCVPPGLYIKRLVVLAKLDY